ncbi:hypothetical protein GCM10027059_49770 [Myceligenerans halotolerans]
MEALTLHDGGAVRLDVVLPQAPWAGPGVLDGPGSGGRGAVDDGAVDVLVTQARSSEPGPWLAGVLEALAAPCTEPGGEPGVLGRLDAVELAGVVAAAQRLAGWAQALQARAAAALVTVQGGILGMDQAATVVKDRLHVTAGEGSIIVNRADRCARFPDVLDALDAGRIDVRKADTLLGAGAELSDDERDAAIQALLPEAPTRTWKWLSDQLNALANRLYGSGEELQEAAAGSNVWLETSAPGMGLLTALMPAKDAARVFNAVQAGADQLMRQPGQTRRRGQARAAALTSLVTGRMVPHPIDETQDPETPEAGDNPPTATTGGVPAGPTRLTVPTIAPGTLVPPVRDTDLVAVPDEDDDVLSTAPAPAAPAEAGVVVRAIEVPATINVTVPVSVLADPTQDTPGVLDLLGPIPAETARDIAAEGIWHRLVTDPITGILTDYSTTTYQPPERLRRAVQARDRTCMSSGCGKPAARCDLDHIQPFDPDHRYTPGEPGQTRATNLHALCRRHHNLKSLAGWTLERDPATGTETWTSPTGHTEVYRPEPIDPSARYARTADINTDDAPWTPPSGLTLARPPRPPRTPPTSTPPPGHTQEPHRPEADTPPPF